MLAGILQVPALLKREILQVAALLKREILQVRVPQRRLHFEWHHVQGQRLRLQRRHAGNRLGLCHSRRGEVRVLQRRLRCEWHHVQGQRVQLQRRHGEYQLGLYHSRAEDGNEAAPEWMGKAVVGMKAGKGAIAGKPQACCPSYCGECPDYETQARPRAEL